MTAIRVLARERASADLVEVEVDAAAPPAAGRSWAVPTAGQVIGVALNSRADRRRLGAAFDRAPYGRPPEAPVLYLKPANTWAPHGAPITLPDDLEEVQVQATIGLVMGRAATRVAAHAALDRVLGCVIVGELTEPHEDVYRPAIRQRCRDGFCPIGPWIVRREAFDPAAAAVVTTRLDGAVAARFDLAELVRPAAELVAAVSAFMTLAAGDVLLLGGRGDAPCARAGQTVSVEVAGLGRIENRLVRAGGAT